MCFHLERFLIVLTVFFLPLVGCSSDGGSAPPASGGVAELYGLAVGTSWTYANTNYPASGAPRETVLTKAITGCETITFVDCVTGEERSSNAYVQETTGGNQSPDAEDSRKLYMIVTEDGVVRVKQDFVIDDALDHWVTYSPYFMRLPTGPYSVGQEWEFVHKRCEYGVDGTMRNRTDRRYKHEIIDPNEAVAATAGDFATVHTRRTDMSDDDRKDYWFAAGVGKVKEEGRSVDGTLDDEEELTAYVVGDGTCD